jgi:hypothetical protein
MTPLSSSKREERPPTRLSLLSSSMLQVRLSPPPPLSVKLQADPAQVFGAEVLVFMFVRRRFKVIYEPRTFLTPEEYVYLPHSQPLFVGRRHGTPMGPKSGTSSWVELYNFCCDEGRYVDPGSSRFPPRVSSRLILNKSPTARHSPHTGRHSLLTYPSPSGSQTYILY